MRDLLTRAFQKITHAHPANDSSFGETIDQPISGTHGLFVRFFYGQLPYVPCEEPLSQRKVLRHASSSDQTLDVTMTIMNLQGMIEEGTIATRSPASILNHAPEHVYAFQIFSSRTLKSAFLQRAITREEEKSRVFWVGDVNKADYQGPNDLTVEKNVLTVKTALGDKIRIQEGDVIVSKEGKQVWPRRSVSLAEAAFKMTEHLDFPRPV